MRKKTLFILFLLFLVVIIIISFCSHKREYFELPKDEIDEQLLAMVRENFKKLDGKFAKIPLKKGNSSFTENKERITLCLKDPSTGKRYHPNTIMYVALHEIAHVVNESYGHKEDFRKVFKRILNEAEAKGIWDSKIPLPSTYCGVKNH